MPGRSRLMCAARATHTENDKPVENAPMYQGADLLHRHPCDNHSGPVQYAVSLTENRTLWWRRNAAQGCKLITCSPPQITAAGQFCDCHFLLVRYLKGEKGVLQPPTG